MWAVINGRILETSLGQYINPLTSILLIGNGVVTTALPLLLFTKSANLREIFQIIEIHTHSKRKIKRPLDSKSGRFICFNHVFYYILIPHIFDLMPSKA